MVLFYDAFRVDSRWFDSLAKNLLRSCWRLHSTQDQGLWIPGYPAVYRMKGEAKCCSSSLCFIFGNRNGQDM